MGIILPDIPKDKWSIADWIMFTLGISGAAYELFIDDSQNYFRYVLILALLRLWQTVADALGRK